VIAKLPGTGSACLEPAWRSVRRLIGYDRVSIAATVGVLRTLVIAAVTHVLGNGPRPELGAHAIRHLAPLVVSPQLATLRRRRAIAKLSRPLRGGAGLDDAFTDLAIVASELGEDATWLDQFLDVIAPARGGLVNGRALLRWMQTFAWQEPGVEARLATLAMDRLEHEVILLPRPQHRIRFSPAALWGTIALVTPRDVVLWPFGAQTRLETALGTDAALLFFAPIDGSRAITHYDQWLLLEAARVASRRANRAVVAAACESWLREQPRYAKFWNAANNGRGPSHIPEEGQQAEWPPELVRFARGEF
jgi:hypothetical protein